MTLAEKARERAQSSLDLWSSFAGREPPPDEDLGQEDTEERLLDLREAAERAKRDLL
jgi:hypothetical protein